MILFYISLFFSAVPQHPWFGAEVAGFTIAKYLGLSTVVYSVIPLARRRMHVDFLSTVSARSFLLLFCWTYLTAAIALGPGALFASWTSQAYVTELCLFFVILVCVDSFPKLQYSVMALVGALAFASLYSLREYQKMGFGEQRVGWVVGDANYFSAAALLTMPLAYHLASAATTRTQRWWYRASLVLTFLAFVVSGSRGGLAGLCAQFGLLFLRSKKRVQSLMVAALMLIVLIVSPVSPIRRALHPSYGDTASTNAHTALRKFGIQMAMQHPLTGIGLGQFKRASALAHVTERSDGFIGHNTYIELAAELGLPGLLLYMTIIVSTWILLSKVRKQAKVLRHHYLAAVSLGLQEGLVGFSVAGVFISAEYEKLLWIAIFLTVPLGVIAHREFDLIKKRSRQQGENTVVTAGHHDFPEGLAVGRAQSKNTFPPARTPKFAG